MLVIVLNDQQFTKKLYHGTPAELAPGDVVEPREQRYSLGKGPTAFASDHHALAQSYAQNIRPQEGQQSMFGHVYEVERMGETHDFSNMSLSKDGFRVVKHVSSHPIQSRDED